MNNDAFGKTIAVIGGTGNEGKALIVRWVKAGCRVIIGSRIPQKAQNVAHELTNTLHPKIYIKGTDNHNAAKLADIVVLTVPYAAHRETLETIKDCMIGKLLIDVTVPLIPPKITRVNIPPAGSATQEALEILGREVQVTSAFQNISYEHFANNESIECDVLVTGTSKEARLETLRLVAAAGFTGWDAGPIENSIVVEGLTSVLIGINIQYGSRVAGIRITGIKVPDQDP
jgi:NADPH-dependent F420 reductase